MEDAAIDYDKLDEEDSVPTPEAVSSSLDTPVEGPQQFEQPEAPGDGLNGPDVQASLDDFVPPVPAEAVEPEAAPATTPGAFDVAKRQGVEDVEKAKIESQTADRVAEEAKQADMDSRLAQADYLEKRQQLEGDLDAKIKAFSNAKFTPHAAPGWKGKLAVIFGGLGAAYRSAGGGDSHNAGVDALQKKWHDEAELQKANIGLLKDQAVMARTRLADADEGRRMLSRDADARLIAKYNLAIKQGESQLKARGVPQAQINADGRIVSLRQAQAAAVAKARAADDAHALNQARINALNAKAARDQKKAKGGAGGGGGASPEAVAQYLVDNPGDVPGAMRVAGPGFDSKRFDKIVANTKPTESQAKNAQQSKIGLDAIDAIEKSGYAPTRDEIQKWMTNQRLAGAAAENGTKGALLTAGQWFNLVPQSEVEGLSPEAKQYFANVRRYVEPIARSQSGAAISASEWENFFNQYGPNSQGGLAAAKQYLANTGRISGVAGRSLPAGNKATETPAKSGPPKPPPEDLARMRKAKARGIHDFDAILEQYRGQ